LKPVGWLVSICCQIYVRNLYIILLLNAVCILILQHVLEILAFLWNMVRSLFVSDQIKGLSNDDFLKLLDSKNPYPSSVESKAWSQNSKTHKDELSGKKIFDSLDFLFDIHDNFSEEIRRIIVEFAVEMWLWESDVPTLCFNYDNASRNQYIHGTPEQGFWTTLRSRVVLTEGEYVFKVNIKRFHERRDQQAYFGFVNFESERDRTPTDLFNSERWVFQTAYVPDNYYCRTKVHPDFGRDPKYSPLGGLCARSRKDIYHYSALTTWRETEFYLRVNMDEGKCWSINPDNVNHSLIFDTLKPPLKLTYAEKSDRKTYSLQILSTVTPYDQLKYEEQKKEFNWFEKLGSNDTANATTTDGGMSVTSSLVQALFTDSDDDLDDIIDTWESPEPAPRQAEPAASSSEMFTGWGSAARGNQRVSNWGSRTDRSNNWGTHISYQRSFQSYE